MEEIKIPLPKWYVMLLFRCRSALNAGTGEAEGGVLHRGSGMVVPYR